MLAYNLDATLEVRDTVRNDILVEMLSQRFNANDVLVQDSNSGVQSEKAPCVRYSVRQWQPLLSPTCPVGYKYNERAFYRSTLTEVS